VIVSLVLLVVPSVVIPLLLLVDVSSVWLGVVVGELTLTDVVVGLSWEGLVVVLAVRPWYLAGSSIAAGDPAC
jgi:hypothetical protein